MSLAGYIIFVLIMSTFGINYEGQINSGLLWSFVVKLWSFVVICGPKYSFFIPFSPMASLFVIFLLCFLENLYRVVLLRVHCLWILLVSLCTVQVQRVQ